MDIDDLFGLAGPTPGSITGSALGSIAGPAFDSITNPAPSTVAGPTPDSISSPTLGIVLGRVASIVIDLTKSNYFYRTQITAKNLTSSTLYMKEKFWIENIPFGEIRKTWNYILGILDKI